MVAIFLTLLIYFPAKWTQNWCPACPPPAVCWESEAETMILKTPSQARAQRSKKGGSKTKNCVNVSRHYQIKWCFLVFADLKIHNNKYIFHFYKILQPYWTSLCSRSEKFCKKGRKIHNFWATTKFFIYFWGSTKFLNEWWGCHCSKRGTSMSRTANLNLVWVG